jgi:transposase, IS30 family
MARAVAADLRRSISFDNGTEFAEHLRLQRHGIATYFCDVRSPWQKGGIENAIGRLRRILPRKTNLDTIPKQLVETAARAYNNTPRKCLGFKTPAETFHLLHFKCESTFPPARE